MTKETLTRQRLTLLGWAFAATLCGVAGLAAFQTGQGSWDRALGTPNSTRFAGVRLPDAGPVSSTASIGPDGQQIRVGVYDHLGSTAQDLNPIAKAHVETLQKEVVGLRRRIAQLSEQNSLYSRRLANLEELFQDQLASLDTMDAQKQTAPTPKPIAESEANAATGNARTGNADKPAEASTLTPREAALAIREQITSEARGSQTGSPETPRGRAEDDQTVRSRIETIPAPETRNRPFLKLSDLPRGANRNDGSGTVEPVKRPVRIVQLPKAETPAPEPAAGSIEAGPRYPQEFMVGGLPLPAVDGPDPMATASIAPGTAQMAGSSIDRLSAGDAPEETIVIAPSPAAGRNLGTGAGRISRSDFALILNHFADEKTAARAWARFKAEKQDRMKGLEARVVPSTDHPGEIDLLVGPFANAADTTVACVHLLERESLCHPVLFSGTALPLVWDTAEDNKPAN